MENIGNFLSFAEKYGVPNVSLFQTVDLYEDRDVGSVSIFDIRPMWLTWVYVLFCTLKLGNRKSANNEINS